MIFTSQQYRYTKNSGSSIIEMILAMALFSFIGTTIASLAVGGFVGLEQGGEHTEAKFLAQEGMEGLHSIRDRAWNEFKFSQSGINNSGGSWDFLGEGTDETIGDFTRTMTFSDVCRDGSDDITTCPGLYADPHIKEAIVSLIWTIRTGIANTVENIAYISNWDSVDWTQTDWSGGDGQAEWSQEDEYDSDDGSVDGTMVAGQLMLATLSTTPLVSDSDFEGSVDTDYDWPFTTSGNYTYDSGKIEVTGGKAQLIASGGSSSSGDTTNDQFTSGSTGWTFNTWSKGGGDVTPTGTWQSSGGNTGGYVDINIPSNAKNDKVGGYWEQSISITENSATVTCSFDWRITGWVAGNGVDDYQFYVFLDSATGEPTIGNAIWSSGTQGGTTAWSGQQNIDCSSAATTSGTYYYKIAVWLDAKNKNTGPITAGYDNAKVHWEKVTGGTYPTDEPTIVPTTSYAETGVISWDSFTETATKNGGEIYYQLSDDDGSTWQYWSGSAWDAVVGATDYNTASVVNANMSGFSVSNEKIMFQAFLVSDGSQFVQLDNVNIGFTPASSAWSFFMWDAGGGEVDPTGTRQTSGGNPNGYVEIDIPSNAKNDEVGGYWEQAITVSDNGETLTCEFDWFVDDWTAAEGVDDNQLYVFLDSSSGVPTIGNEIWASGTLSGTSSWASVSFDCSSTASTAGTYYLKVSQWLDAVNKNTGPITVGYDNIQINSSASAYELSGTLTSSAFDMGDSSPVQIIEWDETIPSCSPSCTLQFQVRSAPDSGGSPGTWTSWYGATGAGTYFTNKYGTLISTDLNGGQWVQYKVDLAGDGSDTPILEEVRVNYK